MNAHRCDLNQYSTTFVTVISFGTTKGSQNGGPIPRERFLFVVVLVFKVFILGVALSSQVDSRFDSRFDVRCPLFGFLGLRFGLARFGSENSESQCSTTTTRFPVVLATWIFTNIKVTHCQGTSA